MNIFELITQGAKLLSENLEDINPRFESELLLAFVLKKNRYYLLMHNTEKVEKENEELFFSYIKRRASGEPYAYITGTKEFMSLEFNVCPGVLIPRPDSETLVNLVIEKYQKVYPLRVLDLCTGSGAIAISIAKYINGSRVTAIDISTKCVELARENAKKHGTQSVNVIQSDILLPLGTPQFFDCVVANPPYIKTDDIPELMKDVKYFEPFIALDGGIDGLVFYRKIARDAKFLLKEGGMLALEIGHDQAKDVYKILKKEKLRDISFREDLSGIKRVIYAYL